MAKAKETPEVEPLKVEAPVVEVMPEAVEPTFDASVVVDLARIFDSASYHAKRVSDATSPTFVFALKYEALAQAAKDLIDLISERGHTGVQNV